MTARSIYFFSLALLLCGAVSALAGPESNSTWDAASAKLAAHSVDTSSVRNDLVGLTISGQGDDVITLLDLTAGREDWPAPARDKALLDYVRQLRSLPSDVVSPKVMAWLKQYDAQVMVPHEDHPGSAIALFDVRRTAFGVENSWRRQDATTEGLALMASNPRSLVDAFMLDTHPAARRGYIEALAQANREQLGNVGLNAIFRIKQNPELTDLGGRAALLAGDLELLQDYFVQGRGVALSHLMRQSAASFSAKHNAALLEATLAEGPAVNASLAIAELTPAAASVPATQELLLAQLGDRELGSAAALALSRYASDETLRALVTMADSGSDSLAARRAKMALELGLEVTR